ncbi:MAG TPA: MBL fold metallo-hydrolase [Candidatus Hydrogenedentes bacterium]|nr:MBL fold metallo-hydrolase [Candidatus Hydrogenedentota bacterium]
MRYTDGLNPVETTPAAVVIAVDGRGRILLARRHEGLAFLGGHHAFPGGRLDEDDNQVVVEHAPPDVAPFVAAACREFFEETGILLGVEGVPHREWPGLRARLLSGQLRFSRVLADRNARVDGRFFRLTARWVTPVFVPRRFDTAYFLVRQESFPPVSPPAVDPPELTALEWCDPSDALDRWRRDEIRLSTPVSFVLRAFARLPESDVLNRIEHPPQGDDGRAPFIEPRPGIAVIPLRTDTLPPATHTNCVTVGWERLAIIDPGPSDAEQQALLRGRLEDFQALGACPAMILLTHGHGDHMGAVEPLARTWDIPVYGHPLLTARFSGLDFRPLRDGDVIEVPHPFRPWRIRALHAPGHCPDHVAFLEETTGTLVAGDLVSNPGTILISPEHGGDMTAYLDSLNKLLEIPEFTMLVPAHGWPLNETEGRELIVRTRDHRLERENRIRVALARGARSMTELLAHAYADVAPQAWPLARLQARAHLARLGVTLDD